MPPLDVNLPDELDRFVRFKAGRGCNGNASEVVRAALRSLDREERTVEAKLAVLQRVLERLELSLKPR